MHPLGLPPLWGRGGVTLSLFFKKRQHQDYLKTLKNLILHLFRTFYFPVQQDTIIDATCLNEREPGKL
jgi:hypothetical protein